MNTPALPSDERSRPEFRCSSCDKVYYRSSHLRRHEVTHTGQQSSQCPFCGRGFVKVEVARRHAKSCARKRGATVPHEAKRGRKARRCEACARSKVSCDTKAPCARCRSRGIPCSYKSPEDRTESPPKDLDQALFLLSFTDPSIPSYADAIATDVTEDVDDETLQHLQARCPDQQPNLEDDILSFTTLLWSPSEYLSRFGDDPYSYEVELQRKAFRESFESSVLEARLEETIELLAVTSTRMPSTWSSTSLDFDVELARSVLVPRNVREFLCAHIHRNHGQIPIVHWPTFEAESTSPELLLALIATGSVYAAPTDHALSARQLFPIIEEIIFAHEVFNPNVRGSQGQIASLKDIEVLQAALLITSLLRSFNDVETRRRIRVERHPRLIDRIRFFGLVGTQRGTTGQSWEAFIEDEVRIRLVTWAFSVDSHNSVFFNSAPQMSLSEMTGDMPCPEEVFEAQTAPRFYDLISSQPVPCKGISLSRFVTSLLYGPWSPSQREQCKNVPISHLVIAINALQSTTFTARTSCLGRAVLGTILRATERWEDLWRTAIQNLDTQPNYVTSLMRNTVGVCWLIKTIAKASLSGDTSCRYMQNIATDSLEGLHEFICKYKGM